MQRGGDSPGKETDQGSSVEGDQSHSDNRDDEDDDKGPLRTRDGYFFSDHVAELYSSRFVPFRTDKSREVLRDGRATAVVKVNQYC